jgi:hypothetical protein
MHFAGFSDISTTVWILRGPEPRVLLVHEHIKVEMGFITKSHAVHSRRALLHKLYEVGRKLLAFPQPVVPPFTFPTCHFSGAHFKLLHGFLNTLYEGKEQH